MRVIPLLLLPFIILMLFVSVFTIVKLLMGQPVDQIMAQLANLWQVYKSYLQASTVIVGAPAALYLLWKNKQKLKNLLSGQKKP